jgi:hypothetical protein
LASGSEVDGQFFHRRRRHAPVENLRCALNCTVIIVAALRSSSANSDAGNTLTSIAAVKR